jgi:cytochrome c-type biogenesis protein CcmE
MVRADRNQRMVKIVAVVIVLGLIAALALTAVASGSN